MIEEMRCPDCGGEMEEGFLPDTNYGAVYQVPWHRGDPKAKKSFVEKIKSGAGVKYDPSNMIPITAYRCAGCGLVKLYALQEE